MKIQAHVPPDSSLAYRKKYRSLARALKRYHFFAEHARDIVLFMRENGEIVEANGAAMRHYGYPPEELAGRTLSDLAAPGSPDGSDQPEASRATGGHSYASFHRRKDGTTFPVDVSLYSQDNQGQLSLIGIVHDATERREAELLLSLWNDIFRHTQSGVAVCTSNSKVMNLMNPAFARMHGYSVEELLGKSIDSVIAPGSRVLFAEYLRAAGQTGACSFETMHVRKDGASFPVWVDIHLGGSEPGQGPGQGPGQVLYRIVNVQDITRQKEDELEISRLAQVVEQAGESVVITATDGSIVYVNPFFERISGYQSGEVVGKNLRLLKSGYQGTDFYQDMWQTISSGKTWRGMLTNRSKDGALFHEQATIFPLLSPKGEIINYAAVKRDVTDYIQHEIDLEGISTLSTQLRLARTRAEMLPVVLEGVMDLLKARGGLLAMVDRSEGRADPAVQIEISRGSFMELNARQAEWVQAKSLKVLRTGKPYYSPDSAHIFNGRHPGTCLAITGVPLLAQDMPVGALWISRVLEINANELRLLVSISNIAANAIYRATLHNQTAEYASELNQAYENTVEGWTRALELRDKETEGHTRRVADLTVELARAIGITESDLVHIRRGALLHDIGKMGIPDRVLLKPGPLDDDEWKIMRQHPTYAYDLLSPIPQLRPALDIPYYHHEHWDGTGYPFGLKSQQIPLSARVFSVVDVWDALCSHRPYRDPWPAHQVKHYIQGQSGKHFDPDIVKVFMDVVPDKHKNTVN